MYTVSNFNVIISIYREQKKSSNRITDFFFFSGFLYSPIVSTVYSMNQMQLGDSLKEIFPEQLKVPQKYNCSFCTKIFTNGKQLAQHTRIHTGERPYVCPTCQKAFTQLGNLQLHKRIHEGTKPFQCASCEYSATQMIHLQRHVIRKHQNSWLIFRDCSEFFLIGDSFCETYSVSVEIS